MRLEYFGILLVCRAWWTITMRLKLFILSIALVTGCSPAPIITANGCDSFDPCITQNGIAVLAPPEVAKPILLSAQEGARYFKRYFGKEALPIAIVSGGKVSPEMHINLKEAGYESALPWLSANDKIALAQSTIRRQLIEQTKGMPPEQQEAIIKMALAKMDKTETMPGTMSAIEQGALTHELGHKWFISAFPREDDEVNNTQRYGGWAPDWLDETAAVLLENESMVSRRRKAFKTMKSEDLYPLKEFFTMEHPALKSALALNEKFGSNNTMGESRAIILTDEKADEFLQGSAATDPTIFYTQARGFADYVMSATQDEQIFAKLAQHLSVDQTLESWLAQTDGLDNSLEALTQDWNKWLETR